MLLGAPGLTTRSKNATNQTSQSVQFANRLVRLRLTLLTLTHLSEQKNPLFIIYVFSCYFSMCFQPFLFCLLVLLRSFFLLCLFFRPLETCFFLALTISERHSPCLLAHFGSLRSLAPSTRYLGRIASMCEFRTSSPRQATAGQQNSSKYSAEKQKRIGTA